MPLASFRTFRASGQKRTISDRTGQNRTGAAALGRADSTDLPPRGRVTCLASFRSFRARGQKRTQPERTGQIRSGAEKTGRHETGGRAPPLAAVAHVHGEHFFAGCWFARQLPPPILRARCANGRADAHRFVPNPLLRRARREKRRSAGIFPVARAARPGSRRRNARCRAQRAVGACQ
jgi:hypothetical protein